jgi:hypothetical protein
VERLGKRKDGGSSLLVCLSMTVLLTSYDESLIQDDIHLCSLCRLQARDDDSWSSSLLFFRRAFQTADLTVYFTL